MYECFSSYMMWQCSCLLFQKKSSSAGFSMQIEEMSQLIMD